VIYQDVWFMYSFEVCYKIKITGSDSNEKCNLENKDKEPRVLEKGSGRFTYEIKIPRDGGKYPNNQLCTFSFPPPQSWHVYMYTFEEGQYNIEQSSSIDCRCPDSLVFEHTEVNDTSPVSILSCGDQIDSRLDGKELKDSITITFRSNEKVRKHGTHFFISEYSLKVCKLVSMIYHQVVR